MLCRPSRWSEDCRDWTNRRSDCIVQLTCSRSFPEHSWITAAILRTQGQQSLSIGDCIEHQLKKLSNSKQWLQLNVVFKSSQSSSKKGHFIYNSSPPMTTKSSVVKRKTFTIFSCTASASIKIPESWLRLNRHQPLTSWRTTLRKWIRTNRQQTCVCQSNQLGLCGEAEILCWPYKHQTEAFTFPAQQFIIFVGPHILRFKSSLNTLLYRKKSWKHPPARKPATWKFLEFLSA